MKKILFLVLALTLTGAGSSFADVQVDKGQGKSTADIIFTVVRNGRTNANYGENRNNGNVISSGSVVVWDTVSRDGVSIELTGLSGDGRVAGIMIDTIPGSSRDTTAATDEGYDNWGRMQVWGFFNEARWASAMAPGGGSLVSGSRVGTSALPGALGRFVTSSSDVVNNQDISASRDSVAIILENTTAGDTNIDVFVKAM